jgi:GntR family transcriptional regulator
MNHLVHTLLKRFTRSGLKRRNLGDGPMNVTFNNRDPVYLQVVRHFKEEIATGRLAAGQEIPSRRELAGLLHINANTAQRAYKEMEEQRLITTEGNSPSRITLDGQILNSIREELIREAVDAFVGSVMKIAVPVDELLHLVKEKYESERAKE